MANSCYNEIVVSGPVEDINAAESRLRDFLVEVTELGEPLVWRGNAELNRAPENRLILRGSFATLWGPCAKELLEFSRCHPELLIGVAWTDEISGPRGYVELQSGTLLLEENVGDLCTSVFGGNSLAPRQGRRVIDTAFGPLVCEVEVLPPARPSERLASYRMDFYFAADSAQLLAS